MLRIALCDDEEVVCSELKSFIIQACKEIHIESEIDIFSSGSILKKHLIDGSVYNIFFLDIELNDESGITISGCIRACSESFYVRIFVHNFVVYKEKIRRNTVVLQGFLTQ